MPVVKRWWSESTAEHGRRFIHLRHGMGWTVETIGDQVRSRHFATEAEALAYVDAVIAWTGDPWHVVR